MRQSALRLTSLALTSPVLTTFGPQPAVSAVQMATPPKSGRYTPAGYFRIRNLKSLARLAGCPITVLGTPAVPRIGPPKPRTSYPELRVEATGKSTNRQHTNQLSSRTGSE